MNCETLAGRWKTSQNTSVILFFMPLCGQRPSSLPGDQHRGHPCHDIGFSGSFPRRGAQGLHPHQGGYQQDKVEPWGWVPYM